MLNLPGQGASSACLQRLAQRGAEEPAEAHGRRSWGMDGDGKWVRKYGLVITMDLDRYMWMVYAIIILICGWYML